MSEEQDLVTVYWNSPVTSEGAKGHLTPRTDLNIDNLQESVNDDDEWDLDAAMSGGVRTA